VLCAVMRCRAMFCAVVRFLAIFCDFMVTCFTTCDVVWFCSVPFGFVRRRVGLCEDGWCDAMPCGVVRSHVITAGVVSYRTVLFDVVQFFAKLCGVLLAVLFCGRLF